MCIRDRFDGTPSDQLAVLAQLLSAVPVHVFVVCASPVVADNPRSIPSKGLLTELPLVPALLAFSETACHVPVRRLKMDLKMRFM